MSVRALGQDPERDRMHQAAQALETLLLKQIVVSSKAFTGGEGAGSAVRADMFADALAEALVKGGGIGLAKQIEESIVGKGGLPGEPAASATPPTPPAATTRGPTAATPPKASSQNPIPTPASNLPRVTSPYGPRQDPFDGHLTRHQGVDLAGKEGTPIRAAAAGVVKRSGPRGGYGNAVEIDHGNGLTTVYAHASDLLVREGEHVTSGQPIALVGHTGRATGAHLHFEVRLAGKPVDPVRALKTYGLRADGMVGSRS
ncbi:MAG TPA: peptidoglycan DD-metalloendopeptidase family protein [Anaeromyxobacteraceae bacterium]|nr:peptidoglycan DD-metalloendopeptidase family protein [Anaeromyxobacteraceae bacterium]